MSTSPCRIAASLISCALLLSACSGGGTSPSQPSLGPQPQLLPKTQDAGIIPSVTTAPFHIETWAYDASGSQGSTAPASLVAKYVTFAESGGNDKALSDCHTVPPYCNAIHYIDASRIYTYIDTGGIIAKSQENWWLHYGGYTDFAHRIRVILGTRTGYVMNQNVPAVQAFWQSYIRAQYPKYDALMTDDMGASITSLIYGTNATSVTELKTDAEVVAMAEGFSAKLTRSNGTPFYVVANGVSSNPYLPHALQRIGTPPNVHGLISEGVPIANGVITKWYPYLLDLMSQVNARPGFIVLLSYGTGTVASVSDRYFHTATIWLGYSPGHEVSWEDLEGGTRLKVWPEETIYPTLPVQSMSTGNTNLLVQPKVWRREFRACYLRGAFWGHCAVLVNTNSVAVALRSAWLTQGYANQIRVVGGDVQDPAAAVSLGMKPASIPANGAVLLYGR